MKVLFIGGTGIISSAPFAQGVREIMAWYDGDPSRLAVDEGRDQLMDRIIAAYGARSPEG